MCHLRPASLRDAWTAWNAVAIVGNSEPCADQLVKNRYDTHPHGTRLNSTRCVDQLHGFPLLPYSCTVHNLVPSPASCAVVEYVPHPTGLLTQLYVCVPLVRRFGPCTTPAPSVASWCHS